MLRSSTDYYDEGDTIDEQGEPMFLTPPCEKKRRRDNRTFGTSLGFFPTLDLALHNAETLKDGCYSRPLDTKANRSNLRISS